MEKIVTAMAVLTLVALTVPDDAHAFRCGSGLINVGDKAGKVLIECGPPTHKEVVGTKTKEKSSATVREQTKRKSGGRGYSQDSSRKVERWFYNCGEHDFIYVLTFSGGVLEKEETEGFGRGKSDCRGRR